MNAKRNVRNILVFGAIAIILGTTFLPIVNPNLSNTETIGKESLMKSDILNDNPSQIGLPIVPIKKRWSRTSGKTLDQKIDRSASDKMSIMDESMNGTTLYVGGSGPRNYTNIQDAINDANDGDTVFVYDDSSPYYENVIVNKSINLIGQDRDTTIIEGNYSGNVVNITADLVSISGFTIQHSGCYGAGIYICSNYTNVSGNNISNNWEDGIYLSSSSSNNIWGNTITSNCNDGISLHYCSNNDISNNKISKNYYYGVYLYHSSSNNFSNNDISRNDVYLDFSSNNTVSNNKISNSWNTIYFHYSSNNTISSNRILNNYEYGIRFHHSSGNIISNNKISDNDERGIYLYHSSGNIISNNKISNHIEQGIGLHHSSSNIISNNKISNNYENGIYLHYSSSNIILGNNISSNNYYGIYLDRSSSNNILDNSFFKDGLYVYDSYQNTVSNNLVNSKPLVYLERESDKVINNAGQVILVSCNNITVQNQELSFTTNGIDLWNTNNCLITGNIINSNNWYGIILEYSCNNNISNNKILNNWNGINLWHSSNNNISNNKILNNWDGMYLEFSSNNNISNNKISNIWGGIYFVYSSNNIFNNKISNNHHGIRLHYSISNDISSNKILNNRCYGIGLYYSSNNNNISINEISNNGIGICPESSSNNTISGNTVSNNEIGICLRSSSNITILGNTISNNEYGVNLLDHSDNNTIYYNNFIENDIYAYFKNSFSNCWNRNYWDRPRIFPKSIFGRLSLFLGMGQWVDFPWLNFDWHPLTEPYGEHFFQMNQGLKIQIDTLDSVVVPFSKYAISFMR